MITFLKTFFKKNETTENIIIDKMFTFYSESAAVGIYDPAVLQDRLNEDLNWFVESHTFELIEVQKGDCALIGLKSKGTFKIRLTKTALTQEEKAFAKYTAYMGLKVITGKCYVGDEKNRKSFMLPVGSYDLLIYGLDYDLLNNTPDYVDLKEQLADIVILIQPRQMPFVAPLDECIMFADKGRHYLFESHIRNDIIANLMPQAPFSK